MSRSINSAGPGVRLVQTITRGDPDTVKLVAENTHAYSVIVHVAGTGSLFTDYTGQSSPLELQIPPHGRTRARVHRSIDQARAQALINGVRSILHRTFAQGMGIIGNVDFRGEARIQWGFRQVTTK